MRTSLFAISVLMLGLSVPCLGATRTTDIYTINVETGKSVLVVSPFGETMLLDAGPRPAADAIIAVLKHLGVKQIDYAVLSHFDADHVGAVWTVSETVPIRNFWDYGELSAEDPEKERRLVEGGQTAPGPMVQLIARTSYRTAPAKGNHIVAKPGDRVPIKGLDVLVLSAGGKTISEPLKGAGGPNAACANTDKHPDIANADQRSVGVLLTYGKFRFIDLGDLTWNTTNSLFCPRNLVGTVDAYEVTHHAFSPTEELVRWPWSLACCSPAEVYGLHPRVAILSLGANGHRDTTDAAMRTVEKSPDLEDLWATNKIVAGGEKGHNPADQFIVNIGEKTDQASFIKLSANEDGSFSVTNSRNGFTKQYKAKR